MTADPFASHRAVADALAVLLPGLVEIVLHDLAGQRVVHIANNLSQRKIGDPSGLDEIGFEAGEHVIGPYEKTNWDGATIRSVSVVLRGEDGAAFGVMCINLNCGPLAAARGLLDRLIDGSPLIPQPDKLFRDDWQERINTFVQAWLAERGQSLAQLDRKGKRALIAALHANGGFEGRHAADYVARILGLARATVFNHLRGVRDRQGG